MEILTQRLNAQRLVGQGFDSAEEVVAWMGAMQAQAMDYAKWGIGVRMGACSCADIDRAIDHGHIVRIHILRPTWHFIAAKDFRWMFPLSSARLKPVYKAYNKTAGIDENEILRSRRVIEHALRDGNHLSTEEFKRLFEEKGIKAGGNYTRHYLTTAEIDGMVCSGRQKNGKPTYALTDARIPAEGELPREEALARLAMRYFESHGPATLEDYAWWSGLTKSEARTGIQANGNSLETFRCGQREMIIYTGPSGGSANADSPDKPIQKPEGDRNSGGIGISSRHSTRIRETAGKKKSTGVVHLLPPFDEFVVSFKDRSDIIADEHYPKVMTKNGIFSPTVMSDGRIVGSWNKRKAGPTHKIGFELFEDSHRHIEPELAGHIERVVAFYSK